LKIKIDLNDFFEIIAYCSKILLLNQENLFLNDIFNQTTLFYLMMNRMFYRSAKNLRSRKTKIILKMYSGQWLN